MRLFKRSITITIAISILISLLSGCNVSSLLSGNGEQESEANAADVQKSEEEKKKEAEQKQQAISTIPAAEDKTIKELISQYLIKLYTDPAEKYLSYNVSGTIPDSIKGFIAQKTLNEGNGNPEIGIHMPRFLQINGWNTVGYEIVNYKDKENKEIPEIEAGFVGKNGDAYFYYVKINLKAKCYNDTDFDSTYKEDKNTGTFEKIGDFNESNSDYIKLQAKYEFEIVKEEQEYKISSAKEAVGKYGFQNRLSRLNNDFIIRLPYLSYKDMPKENVHVNQEDVSKYEAEKSVVLSFFNGLKTIDRNRMKLLTSNWDKGMNEFSGFVDKISGDVTDEKSKKLIDTMVINSEYKKNFDITSFPLKLNMERIKGEYRNFQVLPHPAYSQKQKRYIVIFEAPVQKQNGILNNQTFYKFDYYVTLSGSGENSKVFSIRLNQHSTLPK